MRKIFYITMKYNLNNKVEILKGLNHPNIINYYNSYKENGKLYIIMEYAECGDIKQYIKKHKEMKTLIDEKLVILLLIQIWKWFGQLCSALNYIHKKKILHRDLKPGNIFLTNKNDVFIYNLGQNRRLWNSEGVRTHGATRYLHYT